MKYLKTYQLFEDLISVSLDEIRDIFLPLTDDGYDINIENSKYGKYGDSTTGYYDCILISILNDKLGYFEKEVVKDYMDFIKNYYPYLELYDTIGLNGDGSLVRNIHLIYKDKNSKRNFIN